MNESIRIVNRVGETGPAGTDASLVPSLFYKESVAITTGVDTVITHGLGLANPEDVIVQVVGSDDTLISGVSCPLYATNAVTVNIGSNATGTYTVKVVAGIAPSDVKEVVYVHESDVTVTGKSVVAYVKPNASLTKLICSNDTEFIDVRVLGTFNAPNFAVEYLPGWGTPGNNADRETWTGFNSGQMVIAIDRENGAENYFESEHLTHNSQQAAVNGEFPYNVSTYYYNMGGTLTTTVDASKMRWGHVYRMVNSGAGTVNITFSVTPNGHNTAAFTVAPLSGADTLTAYDASYRGVLSFMIVGGTVILL